MTSESANHWPSPEIADDSESRSLPVKRDGGIPTSEAQAVEGRKAHLSHRTAIPSPQVEGSEGSRQSLADFEVIL